MTMDIIIERKRAMAIIRHLRASIIWEIHAANDYITCYAALTQIQ